ncbi:MAG: serine/threonine protein kinase, partial [Planctomycetes bacterium]|nr:serine/threonine protein kinase [Planctomycetota bacterium]
MIEKLGEFRIKKQLGEGGMGAVYLGYQESLDRDVAIKVLTERLCQNEKFIARFKREARSAASIVHPNVIQIYSIGEQEGIHYFAMEYVRGKDLAEHMGEGKKFTIEETLDVVMQVAEALSCAYEAGIIHRDLKPANIMLTERGLVKVTDFGLAKTVSSELDVTEAGTIVGTANYMSPEQGQGKALDVRSDIYSLGIVFYELLAGRVPFIADQASAVLYMHVYEPPPPPSEFNKRIPLSVDRMVQRMLSKDVDDRPADPDKLLAELRGLRQTLATAEGNVPA